MAFFATILVFIREVVTIPIFKTTTIQLSLEMATDNQQSNAELSTDRAVVDLLRRRGSSTINDLMEYGGVTATAIRQRLNRLMEQGLVERHAESVGRGRPTHLYSLTKAGVQSGGNNYSDLVEVLWSEIRAIRDPDIRQGLLKRIVTRMAKVYAEQLSGEDVEQKMNTLVSLMQERDIPFELETSGEGQLPVLTALACPYPDLAEQDRGICSMEKMLFSEILGETVHLSGCRLDGENCCTFEASPTSPAAGPPTA